MDKQELKNRTKTFALRIIKMAEALPRTATGNVIKKQIIRCATSVGANYRAACRARSTADFISKITIVEEEADETIYWMELIVDAELLPESKMSELLQEANELTAIFTASGKTAKTHNPKSKIRNAK